MARIASLNVGWSTKKSLKQAVNATVGMAKEKATSPVAGIVFSSGTWDRDALAKAISSQLGDIPWVGCSSNQVFANRKVIQDGITLGLMSASDVQVGVGSACNVSNNPFDAGTNATAQALAGLPEQKNVTYGTLRRQLVWFMVNNFEGAGQFAFQGALYEGGSSLNWAGLGVGGKGRDAERSCIFYNGHSVQDSVVALAMNLPVPVGVSAGVSFEPIGPVMCITKARGEKNLIEELDYAPALDVFERVARQSNVPGCKTASLRDLIFMFPLGLPQAQGNVVLKGVLYGTENHELKMLSPVFEGGLVRLMYARKRNLILGAQQATREACDQVGGHPGGVLFTECAARASVLGRQIQRELDAIVEEAGSGVDVLGCSSYGEIGKIDQGLPLVHTEIIHVVAFPGEVSAAGEV